MPFALTPRVPPHLSMASGAHIPFGQRPDGRLVEVSQVERGLACNCRCPGCGEPLLAKKGAVMAQHFAHQSGSECSTGPETALHLAAKQLVADRRWIRLPGLPVRVWKSDPQCGRFEDNHVFGANETWHFERVELEKAVGTRRPDALGFIGDAGHGVEIRVTHAVDAEKQAYLAQVRLPSIEVNLAPLVGRVFTFQALEEAVLESTENKKWLYNPRETEWKELLLRGFDAWRRTRLEDLARQERWEPLPRPRTNHADDIRAANARYRALSADEKWRRLQNQLGVKRQDLPSHVRVSLRQGAGVILADNDLWQTAVFAQFIVSSPGDDKYGQPVPREWKLAAWLAERFGATGGEEAARPAARAYLGYLKTCGFLRWDAGELYVVHDRLTAPTESNHAPSARPSSEQSSAEPIRWLNVWPDEERLRKWAAQACDDGHGFDADWFVGWLVRRAAPPTFEQVCEGFEQAEGHPGEVHAVLRGMGIVAGTHRHFSCGEAAPWSSR